MYVIPTREVLLTFDVEGPPGREDFMDVRSLYALQQTLKLLEKYHMRGLFFITGTATKKIRGSPELVRLLGKHEIGFHSSSHSVKPQILEYTDISDYPEAIELAFCREASDINPFTGEIAGEGGIFRLREVFPDKKIESFRAPFNYFCPPHIEALRKLGMKFVFSGDFSAKPFLHRDLAFYPMATFIDDPITKFLQVDYSRRTLTSPLLSLFARQTTVFGMHPVSLSYKEMLKDSLKLHYTNPMQPIKLEMRKGFQAAFNLDALQLFLFQLSKLQKILDIEATPNLRYTHMCFKKDEINIENTIKHCQGIARKLFGYKPAFLRSQYCAFFKDFCRNSSS